MQFFFVVFFLFSPKSVYKIKNIYNYSRARNLLETIRLLFKVLTHSYNSNNIILKVNTSPIVFKGITVHIFTIRKVRKDILDYNNYMAFHFVLRILLMRYSMVRMHLDINTDPITLFRITNQIL